MIQFNECEELVKNNLKLVYEESSDTCKLMQYEFNRFEICINYHFKAYSIIHIYHESSRVGYIVNQRFKHINESRIGCIDSSNDYRIHPEGKEFFNEFIRLIESLKMKSELKDELKINVVKPKIIKI